MPNRRQLTRVSQGDWRGIHLVDTASAKRQSLAFPTALDDPQAMKPCLLLLNASLAGEDGNTCVLLDRAKHVLQKRARVISFQLSASAGFSDCKPLLRDCAGLIIGTGTHWDSWSSHLQRFLEDATPTEGSRLWLGKPAGVIVTMHSVGGKGVLSRLQGVLNTFGCTLPPMSGLVYAKTNEMALAGGGPDTKDLWSPDDVEVLCYNLLSATKSSVSYRAWPVDRADYAKRWIAPSWKDPRGQK